LKSEKNLSEYRIIDSHAHIGFYADLGLNFTPNALIKYLDEHNISASCTSCVSRNMNEDNNQLSLAVEKYGTRLIGLAHLDPSSPSWKYQLKKIARKKFRGVKLHPYWDCYNLLDEKIMFPFLEAVTKYDLPILVHTGNYPLCVPLQVSFLAKSFRTLNFICAHMGVDSHIECVAASKMSSNIFFETSGTTSTRTVERAIREIGYRRILWGSDVPFGYFSPEFSKIASTSLAENQKQAIFFDNAARIFAIEDCA
jgi:predicted TIM-barrel fold metal-dependent hydrolase